MLSRAGGMDIEQVAKDTPEKIAKIVIDSLIGMSDYVAREAAFQLFDDMALVKQALYLCLKTFINFLLRKMLH